MKEEIIELCEKIKNLNHCPNCGGNHEMGICVFCGKENQEMIYSILQLEKKLCNLPSDFFPKDQLNPQLTALYSIRTLKIPKVSEILQTYHYEEKVRNLYAMLDQNFQETVTSLNIKLPSETYQFLWNSFWNQELVGEQERTTGNILMKALLEKYPEFSLTDTQKERFMIRFTETVMNYTQGFKNSTVKIVDAVSQEHPEDVLGSQSGTTVYLQRNIILKQLEEAFPTIFHEIIHANQWKTRIVEKTVSEKDLIELMDFILTGLLPSYYQDNYANLSFEKEAYFYQNIEAIHYLQAIHVKVPDSFSKENQLLQSYFSDFSTNQERIFCNEPVSLEELFTKTIQTHPEYLTKYPQLTFSYKMENNQVFLKTKEELEMDYENYQKGLLVWNAKPEEIIQMYQRRIEELSKTPTESKK